MATIRNPPPGARLPDTTGRLDPDDPRQGPTGGRAGAPPVDPKGAERRLREAGGEMPAATPRRPSAAEAERLAAHSGFVRGGARRRGLGLDVDDGAQVPIPLPVDEVDDSAWEQGTLDDAQGELTVHGHQIAAAAAQLAPGGTLAELAKAWVEGGFTPTEGDQRRLQALAEAPEVATAEPQAAAASLAGLFGLSMAGIAPGAQRVAAALVVAGQAAAVEPRGDGQLAADKLAGGVQAVLEGGSRSVADARGMHEGVSRQLAHQRTFVFKR